MPSNSGDRRDSAKDAEYWRVLLSGEDKQLGAMARVFRAIPAPPRCKLCFAPFKGPLAPIFKLFGFRRWALNQQICRVCVSDLEKHGGGAEVPVSLLFADVRGSTSLAERMSPADYSASLDVFFSTVFTAVDAESGVIDNIVGDGVMAMWIPGFVGAAHADRAVAAARNTLTGLAEASDLRDSFRAGIGVHTGVAYVGVVGEQGSHDFTVLGDVPNTTARLGSAVDGGELALSDEIVAAVHIDTTGLERRVLVLKGKAEPFPVWIEKLPATA